MLRNYLLVSLRNLKRHFTYSFVNIAGLTIGLSCTMVIGMWVYQEYSYDRHFENADKIYRTGVNFFNIGNMSVGSAILKGKLLDYPEVERTSNLNKIGALTLLVDGKEIIADNVFRTDNDFFQIFSYPFLFGDRTSALNEPNQAVISKDMALKLFGSIDVLNRVIRIKDDDKQYSIKGVVSTDYKSHIPTQIWLSGKESTLNWLSAGSYSYALLNAENPKETFDNILDRVLEKEVHPHVAPQEPFEDFKQGGLYRFLPIAITDIHLKSEFKFEMSPVGNEMTTRVFAGVALLILLLASINFINISTARSTVRAKEVGIRKSLGTSKQQLVFQFILESVLICLLSVSLSIVLAEIFLKGFEQLTGLQLLSSLFDNPSQIVVVVLAAILLGIVAGTYPAFYITSFQPVKVLKGNIGVNEKGFIRNGLVLFQFVISISLLVVSMFIFNQLKFIENKDLGFETENVMVIRNMDQLQEDSHFLKQELLKHPNVQTVSLTHRVPASNNSTVLSIKKNGDDVEIWAQRFLGDQDMMECLGFRLVAGRNFSKELTSDTSAIILNETAIAELGFDDPIGKTLNNGDLRIIGVVSDFNFESLKNKVGPVLLSLDEAKGRNMAVKFNGSNPSKLIEHLNTTWAGLGAKATLDYYFLDENFERLIVKERVLSKAVLIFTALAMFISCLGLYGLSVFTAERRIKEIGIRRVLGASVASITKLLSKNFARPIFIAFLIAVPIAYFTVDQWLLNYEYRIQIRPFFFMLGGILALGVGLITVSWQSIKTALKNPVDSLRSE